MRLHRHSFADSLRPDDKGVELKQLNRIVSLSLVVAQPSGNPSRCQVTPKSVSSIGKGPPEKKPPEPKNRVKVEKEAL